MAKHLGFFSDTLDGTCGVGVACGFEFVNEEYSSWDDPNLTIGEDDPSGGAGWFVAGFIDDEECRVAYQGFRKHYKLVFQSPVRVNENSKNQFFFCVFDKLKDPSVRGRRGRFPFK